MLKIRLDDKFFLPSLWMFNCSLNNTIPIITHMLIHSHLLLNYFISIQHQNFIFSVLTFLANAQWAKITKCKPCSYFTI